SFYSKHHDREEAAAFMVAISLLFFPFFISVLHRALRVAGGRGRLAAAAFAGGLVAVAGFGLLATVHLALADAGAKATTIQTTQALNVLDNNDFIPVIAGLGVMML